LDKKIYIYNIEKFDIITSFMIHEDRKLINVVSCGKYVATISSTNDITFWHATSFEKVHKITTDLFHIKGLELVGSEIWVYSSSVQIHVYSLETFQLVGTIPTYHTDFISGLTRTFNRKAKRWQLWSFSGDQSLIVSDIKKPLPLPDDVEVTLFTKTPRPLTTPPESPRTGGHTPDNLKEQVRVSIPYDNEPAPLVKEKSIRGVHFLPENADNHTTESDKDDNSTDSSKEN